MNEFDIDKLYLSYLDVYRTGIREWPYLRGIPFGFPYNWPEFGDLDVRVYINEIMSTIDSDFENFRADSKYLLAILFVQMLLFPIINAKYRGLINYSNKDLLQDIRIDLKTIAKNAADLHNSRQEKMVEKTKDKMISGHTIISTINNSWTQLNLYGKKVWNDKGDKGPK